MPEALIDCVGWALLHFLWQGLLGGVLVAVALVAMRRCSASARYVAAVTALFVLAALPVATVIWLANGTQAEAPLPVAPQVTQATSEARVAPATDEQPEAAPLVARDSEAAMNDVPPQPIDEGIATSVREESAVPERRVEVSPWESAKAFCAARLNWIVNGWLVGVAFLSLRMLVGWGRVQRLKRLAQQPAGEALKALLTQLIERLKVSRPVRLVESALVEVPTVIGWLKPVILLPATALSGLSTSQLEALLAHELAHVRRNDYLINLMQSVIETLLFYHPAVWWLSRRIRIEREHCCDDLAVQVCGDELSYAKALVALEELRGPQLKLAMSAHGGSLLKRVARIIGRPKDDERPAWLVGVIGALLLVAIVTSSWSGLAGKSDAADEKEKLVSQQLPNGTTVELIGLRLLTDDGDVWWSPDGKLISKPKLEVIEKEKSPPKNMVGVLWRWSTTPKPKRYEPQVDGEVKGATGQQGSGRYSSRGTGTWIEYVKWKQERPETATVEVVVSEREPELEYGSPSEDISRLKVLFEKVSLKAEKLSKPTVRVDDSEQTLVMKMRRAAAEFFGGHMLVAFERQVDAAVLGKDDAQPQKMSGLIGWQSTGNVWRIDSVSETLTPLLRGLPTGAWATGYDGKQLFHWSREDNRMILGSARDNCRQYEPKNLFWNSNGGGFDGVMRVMSQKSAKVTAARLNELDGWRVEYVAESDAKRRWSAFVCPNRGYLPLEIEQRYNDRLLWDGKLSDLKEVRPGVWAPGVIRVTSYAGTEADPQRIQSRLEYVVKEIVADEKVVGWMQRGFGGGEESIGSSHPDESEKVEKSPFPIDFRTKGIDVGDGRGVVRSPALDRGVIHDYRKQLTPRWGVDVQDLSSGLRYHNDPWWLELAPTLKSKFDWPKPSLVPLQRLASNVSAPVSDEPLKSLPGLPLPNGDCPDDCRCDSFEWLTKEKLDWKSLDGKVTLIAFWSCWNTDSVATLSALQRLQETYGSHGLQILAVHRPREADYARSITELIKPKFHVVIDAENESGNGELFDALKVRGMPTAIIVDHLKKLRPIADANKLTDQLAELLKAAGANDVPVLKQVDAMPDEVGRAAEAEWKKLTAAAKPVGRISGKVRNQRNVPMAAVIVEVEPRLKLARGGYGGMTVYPDRKAVRTQRTDAGGGFELIGLPQGSYEVRIQAFGFARREFEVAIGPKQSVDLGEVVLSDVDWIKGRVVDDNGQALKDARVEVLLRHLNPLTVDPNAREAGLMPVTTTQADGSFRFENLKVGFYTLLVDAPGHERAIMPQVRLGTDNLKVWLDKYPEPLQRKVSLNVQRAPLQDAMKALCDQAKVEHELDGEGLKSRGLTKNMPVSVELQDVALGDALEAVLARFADSGPLGFAWDGKKVFVSLRSITEKHRLPPLETIKGAPRERYAQYAFERAMKDLAVAERENRIKAGSVSPLALKRLDLLIDVTRIEHQIAVHDNSQVLGQPITDEFKKEANNLLIKRVETAIEFNKLELEIADEANKQKPGSVKEEELQRLRMQVESLEKDLKRLTGKPMAPANAVDAQAGTVKFGWPSSRERSVRLAIERVTKELEDAQRAIERTPGTVAPLALKQLEQNLDALRADLALTLFDDARSDMKVLSPELRKQRDDLSVKSLQALLTWNETKLEIAVEANLQQPGSVSKGELNRLQQDIATFKENIGLATRGKLTSGNDELDRSGHLIAFGRQQRVDAALKELEDAQQANMKTPGTVTPLLMRKLQLAVDAARSDLEWWNHYSTVKLGVPVSAEWAERNASLQSKAHQSQLELLKAERQFAIEANQKQPGSISDEERGRIDRELAEMEKLVAAQTKGGFLRGQVTLTGKIPKLPPIPIYDRNLNYPWRRKDPSREEIDRYNAERAKDPAKFDPRKLRDEALVVSEGGGLENVFIYLKKAPVGWKPTPVPNSAVILWTDKDRFRPRGLIARVGQQVMLSAVDFPEAENFHWQSVRNNSFNIMPPLGKAIDVPASSLKFPETLPREIRSDIHPWKRAQLLVLDHPFAAVTVEGGLFSIEGLPPGTHEFTVWHERHGYLDKKLSVTVKADEPTPELKLSYPAESLRLSDRDLDLRQFDSTKHPPQLFQGADWADINNEFVVKPGEPAFAKFEVRLRNPSKVPLTVQLPEGKWTQRREIKVRTLHVTLEPAADAKRVPFDVPEGNTLKVPLPDDMLDLSGLEPGYWSVILKTPIHEQPSYLHMWIDAPAEK